MAALGASLEGATVLDLFAGSGALGFEALSRGAERVVFVERARGALKVIRDNAELLGAVPEPRISDEKALAHQDAAPDERRTARPGAAPVSATTPEAPPPEPRERPAPAAEVAGDTEHAQEARPAPASDGDRIVLSCPRCATVLQVPRKAAGQNARCRHCNEVFAVVV